MTGSCHPVILTARTAVELTTKLNTEACVSVVVIYVLEFGSLFKKDRVVFTDIYRTITPAGFLKIQRIAIVYGIGIYAGLLPVLNASQHESDCRAYGILGEIYPSTDRLNIVILHCFVCPNHSCACPVKGCVCIITVNSACAFTIMNHACLGSYCLRINNDVVVRRCLCDRPVLSLLKLLNIPVVAKAILEIIEDIGCLAEHNIHRRSYGSVMNESRYDRTTLYRMILGCGNLVAVKRTHFRRAKLDNKI